MTEQEIFDTIITHQRAQGEHAMVATKSGGRCGRLRAKGGRKCPVGLFIPDSAYSPEMEGITVLSIMRYHQSGYVDSNYAKDPTRFLLNMYKMMVAFRQAGIDLDQLFLLDRMQWAHDGNQVKDWEWRWRQIAGEFDLKYKEPAAAAEPEQTAC